MKTILITGGAGFVGSNLAMALKRDHENLRIIALDNLNRRGSELNLPRLKESDIDFVKGDIRYAKDFENLPKIDLLLECSADASALSGMDGNPNYCLETNIMGTIQCLNFARKFQAPVIFLSSSRIYPIEAIHHLNFTEKESRFELDENNVAGLSKKGINENFSLKGYRTIYGTTKLASEMILEEYGYAYNLPYIVNRCGVLTGPWQMGKVDQGFVVLWLANHYFQKPLKYIGFGGQGKQVRDILDIDDLYELVKLQIDNPEKFNGQTFNIGGGLKRSLSLFELTRHCEELTGNRLQIAPESQTRPGDIPWYISDTSQIKTFCGWQPKRSILNTLARIHTWIVKYQADLKNVLG